MEKLGLIISNAARVVTITEIDPLLFTHTRLSSFYKLLINLKMTTKKRMYGLLASETRADGCCINSEMSGV
jgi:hypothetical protein